MDQVPFKDSEIMNTYLLVIEGPTAVGKTDLSIAIAKHYNTEIISCDSRQFYKEMIIGTAVPSDKYLLEIPHHFIHQRSIHEPYSVGQFELDAVKKIKALHLENKIVVMVGGSGLYIDAVCKGLDEFPDVPKNIRATLNSRFQKEGLSLLKKELETLDPKYFSEIDKENPHRIIRALEICLVSGKPYSSFKRDQNKKREFTVIRISLERNRKQLYQRINQRVDLMMQKGLLEEVKSLLQHRHVNALQTVGYKELFTFIDGKQEIEVAVNEIKKNTRRYAKRQMTWMRRETKDLIVHPDETQNILRQLDLIIKE